MLIKEKFCALTTTGLYLRVQEGDFKTNPYPNDLPQKGWFWMRRRKREWPTLPDLGAGYKFTASKCFLFHMFLSLKNLVIKTGIKC